MVGPGQYTAIAIGASSGGAQALREIFSRLPENYPAAIMVVNHAHPHSDGETSVDFYRRDCSLPIKVADEKETVEPGTIYLAPANYHLLVENDRRFALSIDPKVNFSRPSIDVLFESAAEAFGNELVGIVLTGSSKDGAVGLSKICACGGYTIVQDPDSAASDAMPRSALKLCKVEQVLKPADIGQFLHDAVAAGEGFISTP